MGHFKIEISFGNHLTGLFENDCIQENHERPVKVSKSIFDDQSIDILDNTSFFPYVELFLITLPKERYKSKENKYIQNTVNTRSCQ